MLVGLTRRFYLGHQSKQGDELCLEKLMQNQRPSAAIFEFSDSLRR
jgi:hypothetical protein